MKDEKTPDNLPRFIILPSYLILSPWLGAGEEVALLGGAGLGGGKQG